MTRFSSMGEVAGSVGIDLGVTDWHRITQEHVDMFAEATSAREWIHVDPERARVESPYGRAVAHGYLTLSLATPFITQLMEIGEPVLGINYGLGRVRFPAAVPVGSRVRARGRLKAAEPIGDTLRTNVELTYETDAGERPPCVAEVVSLLQPTR